MAQPGTSWIDVMNRQAQDIPERMTPAQVPDQNASMMPDFGGDTDAEDQFNLGMQIGSYPGVQKQLEKGKATPQQIARTVQVKMKGPTSQEQVTDKMKNDVLSQQYRDELAKSQVDQQGGIDQLDQLLKQRASIPQGIDYTPMASFAKFLNPANDLTDAAKSMKPPTPTENIEKLVTLQGMLQQRKHDMSKDKLAALAEQIKASKGDDGLDTMLKLSTINKNNSVAKGFTGGKEELQANMIHKANIDKLDKDPELKRQLVNYNKLNGADTMIQGAKVITPEIVEEYHNTIRGVLGIQGGGGIDERAHTRMRNLGLDAARVEEILFSKPVDVARNKELMDHFKQIAGVESQNIKKQYAARMNSVQGGHGSMYKKYPHLAADLSDKAQLMGQQMEEAGGEGSKTSGKVTVSNGKETFEVDAGDLQHALADGYKPVGGK